MTATLSDTELDLLTAIRGDESTPLDERMAMMADDAPRLILADWLSENGQEARAEFVRVQIELANFKRSVGAEHLPHARQESLRRRESELLEANESRWLQGWPLERGLWLFGDFGGERAADEVNQRRTNWKWTRGFISHVTLPFATWFGETCERCGGQFGIRDEWPCKKCSGSGRANVHGPAIVRSECAVIERVTFSDAAIVPSGGNDTYYVGNLGQWPREYWSKLDSLPTRSAALVAISDAAIGWASISTEYIRSGNLCSRRSRLAFQ